jgi:hypothetical protein
MAGNEAMSSRLQKLTWKREYADIEESLRS